MAKVAKSRKGQLPSKSYVPTELDFAPDPVVLAESGLVCLDFGSWTWVTRNVLDFVKEKAWPLPSMTFLYNTQSGEFVSRVFNRLVESGQIFEGQVLQAKCQTFFQSDYPCLGMNYYESEEFPHHLKFATDCQKVIHLNNAPGTLEGLICAQCHLKQASNDELDIKIKPESETTDDILADAEEIFETETPTQNSPILKTAKRKKKGPSRTSKVKVEYGGKEGLVLKTKDFGGSAPLRKSLRSQKRRQMWSQPDSDPPENVEGCDSGSDFEPDSGSKKSRRVYVPSSPKVSRIKGEIPMELSNPKLYEIDWDGEEIIVEGNVDQDKLWDCPICHKSIRGKNRTMHLKTHLLYHTLCQACGKAHLCAKKLWDHFEAEHHESEVWHVTCAICSETIDIKESRNSLRSHWASCISRNDGDHPDNPDSSMSIRTRKTTPLELYLPSSYLVEYEGQTFTLEGKVPRNQTWTCPLCSFQVKGADKAKHLKHHGKFRISCEICCLAHYCPLKLWDHWHDLHPEHTIWKGKCSVCLDVIDFKDSRTKLQDHFVSCFQASLEVGKDKPKPAPKIEPNSDAARPSRLIRRAQTFRGTTPKHLFHPPTFVVEWEGRDLVLPGYVGPEEAWVCPMCSTEMLGKQRMTHLRIHFFFRMGCEICRLFHLCPKKLWDHYKEKHTDQEIWQALCLVCAELVDIRESREAFRDHLLNCMRAPVMAKKEFGNVVTDPHPDKQVLSRVPQHLFVPNSFEVEWLGQTLTIPGKLSGKGKWTCPLCRETILTSRNCHLRKHNLIRIACGICGLFHMCSYKLWDHYNTLHSESEKWPCKCPVCSEVLDIKESRNKCRDHVVNCFVRTKREKYKANNLTNKSGTIIVCETCGKIFKNKRLMERHVLKIHQDKKLTSKCEVCAIELSDSKLRRHMRNVHLAARFECPMCFKVEKFARVFWEHLRDNHLDRVTEFPCPSCKQVFPINQDDGPNFPVHQEECLRQHLNQLKDAEKQRLLAKPLNYPCPICPKRFQTQYMANSHMRGHKEAGQFCNLCRYKTHSPAHLRAHINRVHGQNSNGMKCEFCNEKFKTQPSLEYHLSSAHGVKSEYPCDQCLLKLPTKVQLRKHQKNAHRGVDFKCSVCQSSFPDRESCENHTMASHYQAHARFQCTACQEVLKSKEELTHHMNTLHGYQLPVENHSTLPHTFSDTQPELVDLVGDARSHKLTPGYSDADPNLSFSIQGLSGTLSGQTIVVNMDDPTNSFHMNV
ncbi:uncharacterized protein LOC131878250 [Tigriopus californicus]|uniref:uncharacterized protein LOC131878250 n=1 Tax=Tigriopus californicus TaxID=6832 RepID=UPI0027DA5806|nr:uncharacterized protein LOC131878250 [Tigriopus californicus]